MCGIVGAVAQRNVTEILVEGLKRLEYRGYDSAGVALLTQAGDIRLCKQQGKVQNIEQALKAEPLKGLTGIAHTRWATHGKPSQKNSHPHCSGDIAIVHNGIIENYQSLKTGLEKEGYIFETDTDTEAVAHLLHKMVKQYPDDFVQAVAETKKQLVGSYAIAAIHRQYPHRIVVTRQGSPLVVGIGYGENFVASDQLALRQVTDKFIYLQEGDVADVTDQGVTIYNNGSVVEHPVITLDEKHEAADKGEYRHYMLKEIFEQVSSLENTLQGRIGNDHIIEESFGARARDIFDRVKSVQIVACGTSYHSGVIAKYWIEEIAGIPCSVEIASEFRYRKTVVLADALFVSISQSGETADVLAALRGVDKADYIATFCVCNVANSSLVRESDFSLMTLAGPEIGVASTKAFTTQLVCLQLLALALARRTGNNEKTEREWVRALHRLPALCGEILQLDARIKALSNQFAEKNHALFLGRGTEYPVAMEGALKLKEISYIHAEAYPAGELKHGPLALVDKEMPVIALAPDNDLLEKVKSNLQEVKARGGKLIVFTEVHKDFPEDEGLDVIELPDIPHNLTPIMYTIPLQLLAYHVAIIKGTDVDQPRNLAKSVTVE
ncbi:MAG: glutamine--fructose-6-phosphate transaminase (isomerizing) [Pseudomonadales bacterium]|nr:glutamine--fructose-6-phosphate transaminase (isomerizing) [Pseudomonadales bacterium]